MNPKQYLVGVGIILIVVGILGFTGVLGTTSGKSAVGSTWWFDRRESLGAIILGAIALIGSLGSTRRGLAVLIGVLGVIAGLYSLFISQTLMGAHFENPLDTIFFFAIGLWGLLASGGGHAMVVESAGQASVKQEQ